MKIAILGIDFPLGKHHLPDERLEKLRNIFHSPKVTYISLDFEDSTHLKDCDGILCEKSLKLDLLLPDLENIENQLADEQNQNKDLYLRSKEALEKEILLNEVPFSEEEKKSLLNLNLVTLKPVSFVDKENLASLPEIMLSVYANSGMLSFFTVNERELRAWAVKKGTTVFEAAGNIHSDIQRGFIKAEAVGFEDLVKSGGLNQAKAKGLVRLEDKGYILRDGDLIQIRFSRPGN
jgi:ribosome-binding ATPase YchF (GTP1/OBG family)